MAGIWKRLTDVFTGGGRDNYAYVTARVRAKRTFLLPPDTFPKLLARDVHEIARTLQEGEYKDEIDALAGRMSGAELIEHATRDNLASTYREVLSWCEGELRDMVELYLGRYDAYNVKTLLRGVFADVPTEEVEDNLIPAGRLSLDALQELASEPTLDELVVSLDALEMGLNLAEELEEMEEVTNLMPLENAVDHAYYRRLVDAVPATTKAKQAFRRFLQREIDLLNLKILLRLQVEDLQDIQSFFVEGGREVDEAMVVQAAQADRREFVQELAGLSFFEDIEPELQSFQETGDLNAAVTAMDRYLVESSRGFTIRHPLSILPIIDFILRKRIEVDNLRAIAHGKETGLTDDTIEELLIQ